ncbi:MAG TPA: bifunctional DNA primase/polymerase [Bryobacteraceae bacterium]|nr:bifunctional DNA primase/polymerase [Bryobacteraceae bacterium]
MNRDIAIQYARNGWSVIPLHSPQGSGCSCGSADCGKPGKHARVREWQKASCDPDTVAAWWQQWPDSNIGLRLDNLVVLDVDGTEGADSLAALEQQHGPLVARAQQRSGSGGWHYVFEAAEGVTKHLKFRPGLDLLTGAGCYIVVDPSQHASGGNYRWVDTESPANTPRPQLPLTVPPAWLLEVAKTKARTPTERVPVERLMTLALEKIGAGSGRNDAGLFFYGQMRDNGYTKDESYLTLREWVTRANEAAPALAKYTLSEARATLNSAYKREPRDPWTEPGKRTNTAKLLEDLSEDIELFHSPKGDAFAVVPVNDHVECWAVDSKTFKGILTSRYFKKQNATPGRDALQSFVDLLCARAAYDGPEKQTHLRFAHVDGRAYLDLGNDSWQVVEIDADGWRILPQSPVCFKRVAGMKPLPIPERGGSLTALRRFINAQDDRHFVLMASWLVGTFLPKGAFPVLLIQGVHGSAKSGTTAILRNLVDPVTVPLSALPRDERELAITANNSGVIAFDNVSGVHQWLSDAFCRIATGAGFRTRTLHTDADEQLFETRRPLLLNGIDDIASRADLLDRGIGVYLRRIADTQRKTEDEIQSEFASAQGAILGALLTAVSTGLRNLPSTKLSSLPRMADFAKWVSACEPALPWEPGAFMRTYLEMRQKTAEMSVENDMVAQALLRMILTTRSSVWEGTSEELLLELNQRVPFDRRDFTAWPKTPASLGRWLRRAEPCLLAVGVTLSARRGGKGRTRLLRVEYSNPDQGTLLPWPEQDAA